MATTGFRVYSDLFGLSNFVQQTAVTQGKNLLIDTLREYFKQDTFYRYTTDAFGFPLTPDLTDLPPDIQEERTTRIYIGDIIIVPNGKMPVASVQYTAPAQVPLADSYFICPISSPCKITQRLHWYNAIDFSHGKCGEPIYAAAGGQVLKVQLTNSTSKWAFGGAGNRCIGRGIPSR